MEELKFHKEIENKLDKLVGMYKDDPLLDGDFKERIINIKTSTVPLDGFPNTPSTASKNTTNHVLNDLGFSNNQTNLHVFTDLGDNSNRGSYSVWQKNPNPADPLMFNYPPPFTTQKQDPFFTPSQFHIDPQMTSSFKTPNYPSAFPFIPPPPVNQFQPASSSFGEMNMFPSLMTSPTLNTFKTPVFTTLDIPQSTFKFSNSLPDLNVNSAVSGYYSDYTSHMKTSPSLYNYTETYSNPAKDKHVTYESNLTVNPDGNDVRNLLNVDQSLTFRRISSLGISNQLSQQISLLLNELKRLKETNAKLLEQLNGCRMELNDAKNKLVFSENQLQSLSRNGKLKAANQERDAAVARASYLEQRLLGWSYIEGKTKQNFYCWQQF
ncbi:hypothetical protein HELRODRAFT_159961 [Helobdella robusta]|uniref:Uncharacterized protein n=1 Tax=Helobdella robusta TaxID=6412 RepID=T1EPL7_HELRO|nr:hypothetical protein HELRODRAFT_159961 [Helobdella robusta]ESO05880.1 hypothetical protein HELRODRAFT_159961 [Helobdella robusta]